MSTYVVVPSSLEQVAEVTRPTGLRFQENFSLNGNSYLHGTLLIFIALVFLAHYLHLQREAGVIKIRDAKAQLMRWQAVQRIRRLGVRAARRRLSSCFED